MHFPFHSNYYYVSSINLIYVGIYEYLEHSAENQNVWILFSHITNLS